MKLKKLLNDDDAVSPVIGVILMVAITVILAAVIATFVLGLGEQVSDTAPNANFQFSYEEDPDGVDSWGEPNPNDAGLLTITHTSGPSIDTSTLGASGSGHENETRSYTDWSTADNPAIDEMSAGDSIDIWIENDDSISVTWESDGQSATIGTYDAPDA